MKTAPGAGALTTPSPKFFPPLICERDDGKFSIGFHDDAPAYDAGMSTVPTVIAKLIGSDTAQAGDISVKGRTPILTLCRRLLANGADPDSPLECYRGSVMCIRLKSIGAGAALTVKEGETRSPRVARLTVDGLNTARRTAADVTTSDRPSCFRHDLVPQPIPARNALHAPAEQDRRPHAGSDQADACIQTHRNRSPL